MKNIGNSLVGRALINFLLLLVVTNSMIFFTGCGKDPKPEPEPVDPVLVMPTTLNLTTQRAIVWYGSEVVVNVVHDGQHLFTDKGLYQKNTNTTGIIIIQNIVGQTEVKVTTRNGSDLSKSLTKFIELDAYPASISRIFGKDFSFTEVIHKRDSGATNWTLFGVQSCDKYRFTSGYEFFQTFFDSCNLPGVEKKISFLIKKDEQKVVFGKADVFEVQGLDTLKNTFSLFNRVNNKEYLRVFTKIF